MPAPDQNPTPNPAPEPAAGPARVLPDGRPSRAVNAALNMAATVIRTTARTGLRRWLSLRVEGAEHVPVDGGVLIAASHTSHADSLALGAAIRRPLLFLGAANLADTRVIGPLLPRLGLLPVERGEGDAGLLDGLAAELRAGGALVVYPEGSRSRTLAVHRPRSGVARMAEATGVPVVPVGVTGTHVAWPVDGRPRLRPGIVVTVHIGAPMAPPVGGPKARRAWNQQLHATLVELSGRPAADGLAPVGGAV